MSFLYLGEARRFKREDVGLLNKMGFRKHQIYERKEELCVGLRPTRGQIIILWITGQDVNCKEKVNRERFDTEFREFDFKAEPELFEKIKSKEDKRRAGLNLDKEVMVAKNRMQGLAHRLVFRLSPN